MKKLVVLLIVAGVLAFTSCSSYVCPTYAQTAAPHPSCTQPS